MSKFCGNCGTELQDDAVVCTNCGVNIAPVQQTSAAPQSDATPGEAAVAVIKDKSTVVINKLKSDKKLLGIVLGAVAGVIALIVLLCVFLGGGYEDAIDRYIDVTYYGDVDAYFDSVPGDALDEMLDGMDMTKSEFKKELKDTLKETKENYEDKYGKGFSVDYKITDEDKITGDDLDDLKDELKSEGISKKSIGDAYEIEVEFTIKGDEDDDEFDKDFTVVEIDGDWYIV